MQSRASRNQYATRTVKLLDASLVDWLSGDALEENDLVHAFYVLVDDAALGEVFDDFFLPAD